MSSDVMAAQAWTTNAELIADVARLYIDDQAHVLDPTYERGTWWNVWRPANLTALCRRTDGTDFRHLDYPDGTFDVAAYDPPYVCPGGRKTSTLPGFHDRYGMNEGGHTDPLFSTPAELQQIINDGLTEMARIVCPRGVVLVKCQDYIWSGKLWIGTHHTLTHAIGLGCELVDRFEMITSPRPQPTTNRDGSPRRQVHARRNLSTLLVLRTPKVRSVQPALDLGGAA
jgi:hypothetical protein